jgi:DtxR family transcriptional regulator, Mn-dependent transcriptional regulator
LKSSDLSESLQDYLKEIFKLEDERGRASTSAIAKRLGVAPSSVTAVLKRLTALGLVRHERYRGAVLTPAGKKAAVEIIRHHRLLESYLVQTLGLGIDEVHAEADRLEHALSEEVEARIDASLGYPTHDPHGDPIPDANLKLEQSELRELASLEPGEEATIRRIPDESGLLRYLSDLRLIPGTRVKMFARAPFGGPLTIGVGRARHAISEEIALRIGVSA